MRAGFYRRGVVRQDHNAPGGVFFYRFVNRANYVLINLLNRFFLGFGIARVARLIGGLDVDDDDIVILERLNRGGAFALELGICEAGCAGDFDEVEVDEFGQSPEEVNSGDACAFEAETFFEAFEFCPFALSPEPD